MDLEKKIATRQSYGEALAELGKENEKIVVLDADLSGATKTSVFAKQVKGKPIAIVANTVKGKGVSFMENKAEWHGKAPTQEEYNIAISELQ